MVIRLPEQIQLQQHQRVRHQLLDKVINGLSRNRIHLRELNDICVHFRIYGLLSKIISSILIVPSVEIVPFRIIKTHS
jgi:hypothetical protein